MSKTVQLPSRRFDAYSKRFLAAAVLALVCSGFVSKTACAEKRVAMVIGNSAYQNVLALPNPANDAAAMGALFKTAGFNSVSVYHDLGITQLRRAVGDFAGVASDADVAVIFYAGHGIEVDGTNYIIPVDATLERDFDVPDETVSLDRLLKSIELSRKLKLVILDACRDNPFAKKMTRSISSRGLSRGLAEVEPTVSNTLIAFAAKAGSIAMDGKTKNSPFTTALLQNIATPGLDLRIAFGSIRDEVLKSTNRGQEPFVYGSLGGGVVSLVDAPKVTLVSTPPSATAMATDGIVWNAIKESKDLNIFEDFSLKFPESMHRAEALRRIDLLRMQSATAAAENARNAVTPDHVVWNAIKDSNSPAIFEEYVKKFPESSFKGEAQSRFNDLKKTQQAAIVPAIIAPTQSQQKKDGIDIALTVLSDQYEKGIKSNTNFKECEKCPQMTVIPGGSFVMGSPENEPKREAIEGPQHKVNISQSFAAGRFAITFDEWDLCFKDGGCSGYQPWDNGWGRGSRPVVGVSWQDAKNYVSWLSQRTGKVYRLLSESEREYIARAGTNSPFWWGTTVSRNNANFTEKDDKDKVTKVVLVQKTMPVESFQPNAWGLYQVSGNIWEWVEDCMNDSYAGAPADGSAWRSGNCAKRVLRGGSWISEGGAMRSASRYAVQAEGRAGNVGFRIARDLAN